MSRVAAHHECIRNIRLLIGINLEHTALVAKRRRHNVELRRHQLARPAPDGEHVEQDGRRAVLQLRLKLSRRHLRGESMAIVCTLVARPG